MSELEQRIAALESAIDNAVDVLRNPEKHSLYELCDFLDEAERILQEARGKSAAPPSSHARAERLSQESDARLGKTVLEMPNFSALIRGPLGYWHTECREDPESRDAIRPLREHLWIEEEGVQR